MDRVKFKFNTDKQGKRYHNVSSYDLFKWYNFIILCRLSISFEL